MGDDELSEIRQRRMAQLQQQAQEQHAELEQQQRIKSQIQMVLMQVLEPDARERLNTIRLTKTEFAGAVEQQLVALAQSGVSGRRLPMHSSKNCSGSLRLQGGISQSPESDEDRSAV